MFLIISTIINLFLFFISLWICYRAEKAAMIIPIISSDKLKIIYWCAITCIIPFIGLCFLILAFRAKKDIEKEFCEKVMNKLMGE